MKIRNDLVQGSQEWKFWRRKIITATDSGPIMGLSTKTPYQLWKEKLELAPEPEVTEKMREGQRLEPIARKAFQVQTGHETFPMVLENDFMGASLDGITIDLKTVVEIKCGQAAYASAEYGVIPDYYLSQMHHQMHLCEVDSMFYYAFNGSHGIVLQVKRDEGFIRKMLEAEKDFYDCIINVRQPKFTSRDYAERDSADWDLSAGEYRVAKREREKWELKEQKYRKNLIDMAADENCIGGGVKVTKVTTRGQVDYTSIPQLDGVDLDLYRKTNTESWRVTNVD
jgi:putative phage-type endonuclease